MAAIKKFFEKRKLELKFKKAGGGHRLTEDTRSDSVASGSRPSATVARNAPSNEAQRAAEAALNRISQPKPG